MNHERQKRKSLTQSRKGAKNAVLLMKENEIAKAIVEAAYRIHTGLGRDYSSPSTKPYCAMNFASKACTSPRRLRCPLCTTGFGLSKASASI